MESINPCPVCGHPETDRLPPVYGRLFWQCPSCMATAVTPSQLPDVHEETHRYSTHNNNIHDPGYRNFLGRLAKPLLDILPPSLEGLDYGCGPGPALAHMLSEAGHHMTLYDPCFQPDPTALARTYDFITCTEVVEHFHHPAVEFKRLDELLRPGGVLAIMTCFMPTNDEFPGWYYHRDTTHVVFYRKETFLHLANRFGWHCTLPGKDLAFMRKPSHAVPPETETGR